MKNILILTLSQGENYGGMLQAFALQEVLRQMGHAPATTYFTQSDGLLRLALRHMRHIVKIILHVVKPSISNMPLNQGELIGVNNKPFLRDNVRLVSADKVISRKLWQESDALIVGSDQVWRRAYVPVRRYLFDFAQHTDIPRISYAASFGRDDLLEYGDVLIKESAKLARKLNGISVREDSGVKLVRQHWGLDAAEHVDPTFLIEVPRYKKLVQDDTENLIESKGELFVYMLDREGQKGKVVGRIAARLGLTAFDIMPLKTTSRKDFFAAPHKYQLAPVTQWLKSFMDAKYVVTDSFHGTVFAIIFNKPFIAIGNKDRGLARFQSLLKTFGLENRLVELVDDVTDDLITRSIDWKMVNEKIKAQQKRSLDYLSKHLDGKRG